MTEDLSLKIKISHRNNHNIPLSFGLSPLPKGDFFAERFPVMLSEAKHLKILRLYPRMTHFVKNLYKKKEKSDFSLFVFFMHYILFSIDKLLSLFFQNILNIFADSYLPLKGLPFFL